MQSYRLYLNQSRSRIVFLSVFILFISAVEFLGQVPTASTAISQRKTPSDTSDPGLRAGAAAAGTPIAGLSPAETAAFNQGQQTFNEIDDVRGTVTGNIGLGPTFNLDGCATCHAQPAIGGSSPAQNPQLQRKNIAGATNPTEFLNGSITPNGPVRELRRISLGGGVQGLFSIKGRSDAAGCNLSATDLRAIPASDQRFRIPTPTYGLGLIEAISDETIAANEAAPMPMGISGHANRSGNDGTITRYGWKAQNASLPIFAGEAYNVEQGVTNEIFPNERRPAGSIPGCVFNATPEDHTDMTGGSPIQQGGDVMAFASFMRYLAPPAPAPSGFTTTLGVTVSAGSIANGNSVFNKTGCQLCHMPSMTTGQHDSPALTNKTVNLYSDMLVHDVGTGDGIVQGSAQGNEFRTAPLWGVGQRLFFLHDGRSSDLVNAIQQHAGEANGVMQRYQQLNGGDQQDLINFLRSL